MTRILRNLLPGVADLPPVRGVAVFIIGEQLNANLTSSDRLACTGGFMQSVCNLAGIENHLIYLRAASMRRNLFRPGQRMTEDNAARQAIIMLEHFAAYERFYADALVSRQVLLCGAWARRAFNMRGEYGRQGGDEGAITWIPHPSGRNRFYNDAGSKASVSSLVQLAFAHAL